MSLKTCSLCGQKKDYICFNKQKRSSDGLQSRCRDCDTLYAKEWYKKNKSLHCKNATKNKSKYIKRNRQFVIDYLSVHPCIDCGEANIVCLDFDHVRGKKHKNISYIVYAGRSLKTLQKEIDKCDIRCANCHRKKTAKTNGCYKIDKQPKELKNDPGSE